MKAVRFNAYKTFPELQDVEKPTPGPGEVLLKIAGAGACHSDVAIFDDYTEGMMPLLDPSYTLGHENSGWIEEVGEGVTGFNKGEAYLVYGPVGCGHCPACSRGQDTYCENVPEVGYLATGLGRDGGMAEYMTVPAKHLVPLGDADPIDAAPLSDAALTPYHAIKRVLRYLDGGGKTALVIGVGGLGDMAIQLLKAMTGATVIATDQKESALERAAELGAVAVPGGEGQAERIRELTGGRGVDAVFDFVGVGPTIELGAKVVAQQGALTVVGIAGGNFTWNFHAVPYEVNFSSTYWGTVEELHELAKMYRAGQIKPRVERYPLSRALEAYEKLRDGKLDARAVVVPTMDE